MEIIEINGYTIEEKHRLPKTLTSKTIKEHGLKTSSLKLSNKVFESVVVKLHKESGVRGQDQMFANCSPSLSP